MSKRIKNMLIEDIRGRLEGVNDVILVCLGQLDAQKTTELRRTLRQKNIQIQLIKNSLARQATLDTPLAPAFTETAGMLAMAWGGEDVVDLAKELDRIVKLKEFEGIEFRGGALDGGRLGPDEVKAVAKWPSRAEQLRRQHALWAAALCWWRNRRPDQDASGRARKGGGVTKALARVA